MLELLSRLELPNLFLTKEALYRLSYNSKYMSVESLLTAHALYNNIIFRDMQLFSF